VLAINGDYINGLVVPVVVEPCARQRVQPARTWEDEMKKRFGPSVRKGWIDIHRFQRTVPFEKLGAFFESLDREDFSIYEQTESGQRKTVCWDVLFRSVISDAIKMHNRVAGEGQPITRFADLLMHPNLKLKNNVRLKRALQRYFSELSKQK
jgi:hypothetical protein